MTGLFFRGPLIGLPRVTDAGQAAQSMDQLTRRGAASDDPELVAWLRDATDDLVTRELLESIFANSPFLTRCALADVGFLRCALSLGPDTAFRRAIDHVKDDLGRETDQGRLMRGLRLARQQVAFVVALADITGYWPLERVTQSLSDFADAALSAAISHLLRQAAAEGKLVLADEHFPEDGCGYVALAMGKHGARELNYSSDIDLICLYEPMKVDLRGTQSLDETFARLTRRLVTIMQERTADGYVCRVDLRLTPDPRAAIPAAAAVAHYANRGDTWERAALIKARPAAGDLALGRQVLGELSPFVWRRHLDFWTIRDIQGIKRRINVERGSGKIGFLGHNIKVGRGGIREIEFFAQTQQLIFGGRDPYLRCPATLDALTTLAEAGCIDARIADELAEAYEFLRQLEHRLQMVNDQQTQTLPPSQAAIARLARFMAFDDVAGLRDLLLRHLRCVETHYSGLFEETAVASGVPRLALAGEQPDEATATALRGLGFGDVRRAFERLRRWQRGGLRRSGDSRCQKILVELTPRVIEAVARTPDPDAALAHFDDFLGGLTPGVSCFSLLSANPALLDLLVEIMTTAPALAEMLSARPEQLQAALATGFFAPLPDRRLLAADSAEVLGKARNLEDALDRAVGWANDHRFQVAIQVMRHSIDSTAAGQAFSDIADLVVRRLHEWLAKDAADMMAVLAFGPHGGRELTFRSSLQLLFVHDGSDAESALRLARRLTSALSAATARGRLYDVDLRTAVWGASGPLVTPLDALHEFCARTSDPQPLLALAGARAVAGPTELTQRIAGTLSHLLALKRDPQVLAAGAARMRRAAREDAAAGPWDVRRRPGGLDDLDALLRVLQLRHGADRPEVLGTPTGAALARLGASGLIDGPAVKALIDAHHLLRQLEDRLAVAVDGPFDPDLASGGLKTALARAGGAADFAALEARLEQAARSVGSAFAQLVEETAE
jgi:glutamate-ammonia-ligase adenylyltransferase